MINWKVRVRQLWFWLTLIPALFLLGDQLWSIWQLLGQIEAGHLSDGPLMQLLLELVGTVFAILVLIGIPVDTTTEGYGDSARALTYTEPAPNASAYGLQEYEEQCAAADAKMVDWAEELAKASASYTIDAEKAAEACVKGFTVGGDAISSVMAKMEEADDADR